MCAMSLHEILHHSLSLLERVLVEHGPERTAVAWTGGKDSTIVLSLWRRVLAGRGPLCAVTLDTGCKFPEIVAFRERIAAEWEVGLHVARPEVSLDGYPLAVDKVACCRALKIEPLRKAVRDIGVTALLTGIRRDEHPSRREREFTEPRTDPDHLLVNPLLDWTEMDVWAHITGSGLPYCELYDRGYRSLGCRPCTAPPGGESERSGRDPDKEANLGLLHSLGYF